MSTPITGRSRRWSAGDSRVEMTTFASGAPKDMTATTRQSVSSLTPGSPGVAPYTETGARFALEASQFEVLDHRPIEAILGEHLAAGATIACYEPAAAS